MSKYKKISVFLLLSILAPTFSYLAYKSVYIVMALGLSTQLITSVYISFYTLSYSFVLAPFVFFGEKIKNIGLAVFMVVSLYGTFSHMPNYLELPIRYMDIEKYRANHINSILI